VDRKFESLLDSSFRRRVDPLDIHFLGISERRGISVDHLSGKGCDRLRKIENRERRSSITTVSSRLASLQCQRLLLTNIEDIIEARRVSNITSAIGILQGSIDKLMDKSICKGGSYSSRDTNFECDSKMLGSFQISAKKQGLLPLPEDLYTEWSFDDIVESVKRLDIRSDCRPNSSSDPHDLKGAS
jgi:hypothetical protein